MKAFFPNVEKDEYAGWIYLIEAEGKA